MADNRFNDIKVEIGGIVLALESHGDEGSFVVRDVYRSFMCDKRANVTFAARYGVGPDLRLWEKTFDSGGTWALYRHQARWCLVTPSAPEQSGLSRTAVIGPDFDRGDVYSAAGEPDGTSTLYPLAYPLEELVFMSLLSRGRGVLLHACALNDNGHGFVFVGRSGAGKSTMADLWMDQKGVTILSDDRVIVRKSRGRFWAYGTPWHGSVRLCSPERVPIDVMFLLTHGEKNSVLPLEASKAVPSLFASSFPTYWDPRGMDFTLDFLSQISQSVRCCELAFLPDRRVVDLVRSSCDA